MSASSILPFNANIPFRHPLWFRLRLAMLAALFVAELVVITTQLDTQALDGRGRLVGAIGDWGPYVLQSTVVFAVVFLAFGYFHAKSALVRLVELPGRAPWPWGYLVAHAGAMGGFALLSHLLFSRAATTGFENAIAFAWLSAGVIGIVAAIFFFVPPKIAGQLLTKTGRAWIYAAAAAAATPAMVVASRQLWKPAAAITFKLVVLFLRPLTKSLVLDARIRTIGTAGFSVEIAPACSGLEGMGLMLVFGVLWLSYFRKNYRFPQALLLIPVGMGLMFFLNAVRIAALILIGNAGAQSVALGGFHSQAGWIAFNAVALGLVSVANRVPWIAAIGESPSDGAAEANPPAAYIVPFLAILAAAMISRATSGTFEWMYPLRFVAAAAALFVFRRKYATMNWSFGWEAPLAGGLVFALWMALDRFAGAPGGSGIPQALASLSPLARIGWLAIRTSAAVVTVPIAEELAFRGFLLRRLIAADFEAVDFRRWTFLAVVGSSVAFGMLHGDRWIAGTAAGMIYAFAQRWRGRIGDAIVAHAVTNALIAVAVLWGGQWQLW